MGWLRLIKRSIFMITCLSVALVLLYTWSTTDVPSFKGKLQLYNHAQAFALKYSNSLVDVQTDSQTERELRAEAGHEIAPEHTRNNDKEEENINNTEHAVASNLDDNKNDEKALEDKIKRRFEERLTILHRACRLYGNSSLFRSKRAGFMPLPVYRPAMNISVRYCPIAKTAATTWSHFLSQIRTYMEKKGEKGTEDRSTADDEIYLTFVRDPYARLLSGYVDKLLTPNTLFWRISGRAIAQLFRQNATLKSKTCGHDTTFPEFVRYVVHLQNTGLKLNGHFIPTHDLCEMCRLPYRYIGHLETIKEDMPFIAKMIRSPIQPTKTYDRDTIAQNAKMILWEPRAKDVRKCMDLDEASRRLWKKYQIRGLISKSEKFPYRRGAAVNITLNEFVQVALQAHERSLSDPGLKAQRTEAMREAFADVPLADRLNVQQMLFLDFQMFGFDSMLEDVFPKTSYVRDKHFSYFQIYD